MGSIKELGRSCNMEVWEKPGFLPLFDKTKILFLRGKIPWPRNTKW